MQADTLAMKKLNLVDGPSLLELIFDKQSRPTLRWLRDQQKRRIIPYVKIGHLVRFDVDKVRDALEKRHTVKAKA